MRGLADERRRHFAGQRPAGPPARVGHRKLVLPDVRALGAHGRHELWEVVDDERNAGAFRERHEARGERLDFRLVPILGAQLQHIHAPTSICASHALDLAFRHVAQVEDSVEASVSEAFPGRQSITLGRNVATAKCAEIRSRTAGPALGFPSRCMKLSLLLLVAWTLALAAARGGDPYSFSEGATGFLIRDYNEKLLAQLRPRFPDRVRRPKKLDEFDAATAENTRLLQESIAENARAEPGRRRPGGVRRGGPALAGRFFALRKPHRLLGRHADQARRLRQRRRDFPT